MTTIIINGVKYAVDSIQTTQDMAAAFPRSAADFERRGIMAFLVVHRPNSHKCRAAYQTRNGYSF